MPRITHHGLFKRCDHTARSWPTCPDPWWFDFYHAGRGYRFSLNKEAKKPRGYRMDKAEAKTLQKTYQLQIEGGTFRLPPPVLTPAVQLTVGDVMDLYVTGHIKASTRKPAGQVVMKSYIKRLRAMPVPAAHGTTIALEAKTLDAVTAADLDVLRRDWMLETTAAQGGRTGPNRALKRLRHFWNWAIEQGHTERTPFKRAHVNTIHFAKEPGRTRRLEGDEEARLLQHATTPLIRVLMQAGLETGCRIGELLQLTWADVKWQQNALVLPATITKTGEARDIPLTQKLRALLELRQYAPDGTELGSGAAVFGNEVGEPVKYWRINQAWHDTCAAAGIQDLHFHDLRRELASTLRESGAPDHIVADVLGHANISTTSQYLKASRAGLKQYVQRLEVHRQQLATAQKQAAAQQRRAKTRKDSYVIRTQAGSTASKSTTKNPSKLLN
jgi:integrase